MIYAKRHYPFATDDVHNVMEMTIGMITNKLATTIFTLIILFADGFVPIFFTF